MTLFALLCLSIHTAGQSKPKRKLRLAAISTNSFLINYSKLLFAPNHGQLIPTNSFRSTSIQSGIGTEWTLGGKFLYAGIQSGFISYKYEIPEVFGIQGQILPPPNQLNPSSTIENRDFPYIETEAGFYFNKERKAIELRPYLGIAFRYYGNFAVSSNSSARFLQNQEILVPTWESEIGFNRFTYSILLKAGAVLTVHRKNWSLFVCVMNAQSLFSPIKGWYIALPESSMPLTGQIHVRDSSIAVGLGISYKINHD